MRLRNLANLLTLSILLFACTQSDKKSKSNEKGTPDKNKSVGVQAYIVRAVLC
jgi:major membrane immunogen (membrane-anchored lipoprotein)